MAMIFFQLRRPFVILINHALMDWTVQVTQAALLNTIVIAERTPGMSTTKEAPPVITIVRMVSVSINVLQSTPSVS